MKILLKFHCNIALLNTAFLRPCETLFGCSIFITFPWQSLLVIEYFNIRLEGMRYRWKLSIALFYSVYDVSLYLNSLALVEKSFFNWLKFLWKISVVAIYLMRFRCQSCIQNPLKHLRWIFFRKSSTLVVWLSSEFPSGL